MHFIKCCPQFVQVVRYTRMVSHRNELCNSLIRAYTISSAAHVDSHTHTQAECIALDSLRARLFGMFTKSVNAVWGDLICARHYCARSIMILWRWHEVIEMFSARDNPLLCVSSLCHSMYLRTSSIDHWLTKKQNKIKIVRLCHWN